MNYSSISKYKLPQIARHNFFAFLCVAHVLQQPKQHIPLWKLHTENCISLRKSNGRQRCTGQIMLSLALQLAYICFKAILCNQELSAHYVPVESPLLHPEGFTENTADEGKPGSLSWKLGLWSCKGIQALG